MGRPKSQATLDREAEATKEAQAAETETETASTSDGPDNPGANVEGPTADNAAAKEAKAIADAKQIEDYAKERAEAEAKEAVEAKARKEASPWHVVEEQSDNDTTIEVCNVSTGFQMPAAILLRCRVDGKIVGDIKLMQGLKVKQIKGVWKLQ